MSNYQGYTICNRLSRDIQSALHVFQGLLLHVSLCYEQESQRGLLASLRARQGPDQHVLESTRIDQNILEQIRTDQNRLEQTRIDQNRLEQTRVYQNILEYTIPFYTILYQTVMYLRGPEEEAAPARSLCRFSCAEHYK